MKLQELNQTELTEINGGGLFGSNSPIQGSLNNTLSIGNLLSISTNTDNGLKISLSVNPAAGSGSGLNLSNLLSGLNLGGLNL
jgi:hypothetical protein